MSQELSVSLERHGAIIDLDMAGAALGRVHIDNGALPEEERAGTAKKLPPQYIPRCIIFMMRQA